MFSYHYIFLLFLKSKLIRSSHTKRMHVAMVTAVTSLLFLIVFTFYDPWTVTECYYDGKWNINTHIFHKRMVKNVMVVCNMCSTCETNVTCFCTH